MADWPEVRPPPRLTVPVSRHARPLRSAALLLALAALAAVTAVSCGYVNPPVMTMAASGTDKPFFTMTWDDLQKKLDAASGTASSSSTTKPTSYQASTISQILTDTVQTEALNQILEQRKIQPSDDDLEKAQSSASQSSGQAQVQQAAQIFALQRSLADAAFESGQVDEDAATQQFFAQNKATYSTADQVCAHVIFVLPNATGEVASDAEMQTALATANGYKQRAAGEDFATIATEVNPASSKQNYPGGDVGCIGKSQGFDDAQWATLMSSAPGAVADPMNLGGQIVVLVKVDEVKPGKDAVLTDPTVKAQVAKDLRYELGKQLQGAFIESVAKQFVVIVDPHYGTWDPTQFAVLPPDGPAQPTIPTTTTTTSAPSLLPSTTTTAAPTTTTTAPSSTGSTPSSTPGSTPGTTR